MKRSELQAWTALAFLLAIAVVSLVGGVMYNTNFFWAAMCLAIGQALLVGLAGWGLRLAHQRAELEEIAPVETTSTAFRMSYADESGRTAAARQNVEAKTLDTGFQRLLITLTSILLLAFAAIISYLIYRTFAWAAAKPDLPFPIAGIFTKDRIEPRLLDELALVMALAVSTAYTVLYWITRIRRDTQGTGEAVNSNFTLGLPAMIAIGVAAILGYLHVTYASEIAASITAALLALQGLELLLNAFRSYSAVEELDQPAVDLQALPLVPMLSSVWLSSVKLLFAQSVGLSTSREKGVLGRMMPRALISLAVIAIFVSCLRSVPAGQVAVLERLGSALKQPDGQTITLLQPGLHLTFPWPIDKLVLIPNLELQTTDVGVALHGEKNAAKDQNIAKNVDFRFWTIRPDMQTESADNDDQFNTGDPTFPQILETYVVVLWRVREPIEFYNHLSHSEYFEKKSEITTAKPIYVELVQQCTSFAVTRTFATHTLEQIMSFDPKDPTINRQEVESHCKKNLQDQLDFLHSGIEVVSLNITDLHPPLGEGLAPLNPARPEEGPRGPAHAYENIVNSMQSQQAAIQQGKAASITSVKQAEGGAATEINTAKAYSLDHVAKARGEADRVEAMIDRFTSLSSFDMNFLNDLAQRQALYAALKDILNPISKYIVDPRVKVNFYQSEAGAGQTRPPGQ